MGRFRDYALPEEHIYMPGDEDDECRAADVAPEPGAPKSPASRRPPTERLKVRTVLAPEPDLERARLPVIKSAGDVARLLRQEYGNVDREYFIVLLLDVRHRVIGVQESAIGSLSGVEVHPRETFKAAVAGNAAAIIVSHIHPSGDPTPSRQDEELTARLKDAGELLGIKLLDHVVLGENGSYTSFQERGRL